MSEDDCSPKRIDIPVYLHVQKILIINVQIVLYCAVLYSYVFYRLIEGPLPMSDEYKTRNKDNASFVLNISKRELKMKGTAFESTKCEVAFLF